MNERTDLVSRTGLPALASAIITSLLLASAAPATASTRGSSGRAAHSARTAADAPHPVAGSLQRIALRSHVRRTGSTVAPFDLVGAVWPAASPPRGRVEVRVQHGSTWGRWHRLAADDAGASAGSADDTSATARRTVASTPLWVGERADGVAARIVSRDGAVRRSSTLVHILLINGGQSPADSHLATIARAHAVTATSAATSSTPQPFIYSRRDWGANERIRRNATGKGCGTPKYASTLKVAFIHHTDTSNHYSRAAVPAIIRSMYRYHVFGHGWCDIGYNFLVDRFGRIWEGRYGGISRPVIGAQAGGFNVDSLGVGMIGTFNSVRPDRAMRNAIVRLLAWRLAGSYRNPMGHETLKATHFYQSRYRAGRHVSFRVISGHRNADYTDCPGARGYAALPGIRRAVMARLKSGLVDPSLTAPVWRFGQNGSATVRSTALKSEAWRLTVAAANGAVVATRTGQAAAGHRIVATWNGRTDGLGTPVPAGSYSLILTPAHGSSTGVPYVAKATVAPEVTITGPATTSYQGKVTLHGQAIPGAAVTVAVSGQPSQLVTASSTGTWTASYVATSTASWTASAGFGATAYTTPPGRTVVVPVVTSPRPAAGVIKAPASTFTLSGTAVPLSLQVSVEHNGMVLATAGVNGDGSWATQITVAGRTTISVVASGGVSSPVYTVVPR